MIDDGIKGYIAGILDGEGTPRVITRTLKREGRVRTWPVFTVGSTDVEMLDQLKLWCGGTITQTGAAPCERPCKLTHIHKNFQSHKIAVKGLRAVIVIENILPWLIIKKEVALPLLDWQPVTQNGLKAVRLDMKERGWLVNR